VLAAPADAPAPWSALRRAAALAAGHRRRVVLSVVLSIGAVVAAMGLLTTSGWLISRAAQQPPILTLTVAIVSVRAFGIARALLRYGERLTSHDTAFRLLADLRVRFFARLAPLVPGDLPRMRRSDVLTRFVSDVDALQDLYLRAIGPPIAALAVVTIASVVAFAILPVAAAAIALVLIAGGAALTLATAAAARTAGRRQAGARAALTAELSEAIEGAPELALAGRGPERAARVVAADARLANVGRRDALAGAVAAAGTSLLPGAAALAVLVVAIPAVHAGVLPGVWLAALAFLGMAACEAVTPLPAAARSIRGCAQSAARLEQVNGARPSVEDAARPQTPSGDGDLWLRDARARYGEGPWVLDGAELRLAPGERVALVGPSGVGKTTIAELLVRFRDPQDGAVLLDGVDARALTQESLRRAVVLAAQDAHLFTSSVRENVRVARPEAEDDELRDALARVGLALWLDELPEGLDTLVGEEGASVSGGQRRRIALARALLADGRFLVLDEPTAHLDAEGARALLTDVFDATPGRGVLVITHDRSCLDLFDRVVELERGRLIDRGSRPAVAAA
jgi:thiol reductant ABC exporter CydC subunit